MQDQINKALWQACTASRGTIEASDYKNYLLTMLFLKYLTDVKGEDTSSFALPDHCSFTYLYEQRDQPEIGALINGALADIEAVNGDRLKGVFCNIDFDHKKLGSPADRQKLNQCFLDDFHQLDLSPDHVKNMDVIGNAYEFLLERFAAGAGRQAGEYYTPPGIAELMVRLAAPGPGETICDPTCGSGSLLIRSGNYIKNRGSSHFRLFGQEMNPTTWGLARMNMMLHNLDQSKIVQGDTIQNPQLLNDDGTLMKFDVVIANPPFSRARWGLETLQPDPFNRFKRGYPPASRGDLAFISHIVETLSNSGRAVVVVPNGVTYRTGKEKNIRQAFVEERLLHAVIGLPENLFYGTVISSTILVFSKSIHQNVLFIDGQNLYQRGKNKNILDLQSIENIEGLFQTRQTESGISFLADLAIIKEKDYNLSPREYVLKPGEEVGSDPEQTFKALLESEKKCGEIMAEMKKSMRMLGYDV